MSTFAVVLATLVMGKIDSLKPRADERGSVTLEQAIITGVLSVIAVAVGAAIVVAITTALAKVTGG